MPSTCTCTYFYPRKQSSQNDNPQTTLRRQPSPRQSSQSSLLYSTLFYPPAGKPGMSSRQVHRVLMLGRGPIQGPGPGSGSRSPNIIACQAQPIQPSTHPPWHPSTQRPPLPQHRAGQGALLCFPALPCLPSPSSFFSVHSTALPQVSSRSRSSSKQCVPPAGGGQRRA